MIKIISCLLALMLSCPAFAGAEQLERADQSVIHFNLESVDADAKQPLILLLQGSHCDPVRTDAKVKSIAPKIVSGYAVLTIEKYGVGGEQTSAKLVEGCSRDYWHGNTLQQRVADVLHVLGYLRSQKWWNGQLVIFGGSEGGWVAGIVAPQIPETKAVVIWSSGLGIPVDELIRSAIPPHVVTEAGRVFAEAKVNPTGNKIWGGASYKWWAESTGLVAATVLSQTDVPILMIQGDRDQNSPVAAARAAKNILTEADRRNFVYREYEGYDHFMVDSEGHDHRDEVLAGVRKWLKDLGL